MSKEQKARQPLHTVDGGQVESISFQRGDITEPFKLSISYTEYGTNPRTFVVEAEDDTEGLVGEVGNMLERLQVGRIFLDAAGALLPYLDRINARQRRDAEQ